MRNVKQVALGIFLLASVAGSAYAQTSGPSSNGTSPQATQLVGDGKTQTGTASAVGAQLGPWIDTANGYSSATFNITIPAGSNAQVNFQESDSQGTTGNGITAYYDISGQGGNAGAADGSAGVYRVAAGGLRYKRLVIAANPNAVTLTMTGQAQMAPIPATSVATSSATSSGASSSAAANGTPSSTGNPVHDDKTGLSLLLGRDFSSAMTSLFATINEQPFTAVNANSLGQIFGKVDTITGFQSVNFDFTNIPSGTNIGFIESEDGSSNWTPAAVEYIPTSSPVSSATSGFLGSYRVAASKRFVAAIVNLYGGSGMVNANVHLKIGGLPPFSSVNSLTPAGNYSDPTDAAMSVSAADTWQQIIAPLGAKSGCLIQNVTPPQNNATYGSIVWVSFTGRKGTQTTTASFPLLGPPAVSSPAGGQSVPCPPNLDKAVSIRSSQVGAAVAVTAGQ